MKPFSSAISEEPIESLYSQIKRTVIRLEHFESVSQEGSTETIIRNVPDGTAFFVGSENNLFIVSARHVVENPYNLHARVQCKNDKTGKNKVVLLELPKDKWIFHNNDSDKDTQYVDVAVMKIFVMRDWTILDFAYEPKGSPNQNKNQLPYKDAEPPKPILVFGFPSDIGFELMEQNPLARFGIVSMKAGKKFIRLDNGMYVEERCYLIDARIFGGNSGSPVMNQITMDDPQPKLLGLVSANNNNLDFAIVEPVSRIRETIDLAMDKEPQAVWKDVNHFRQSRRLKNHEQIKAPRSKGET